MKARLIVCMVGADLVREIGTVIEGDEAVRLCEAGLAVPVTDTAFETATSEAAFETATARRAPKKVKQ
ncbi:hypothetical protein Q0812_10315 [Brevundimonas sp. 2R-24]|uniref:Uncharacterized protein n=1 Tax=Peiella sedimenti TaxID=3061083 RepID=A0ABT8SPE5_9CAUL|nr:hypothetical protein [Caulobacteraceae bacterium XZ-24]